MVIVFDIGATKTRISLTEGMQLGEIQRLPTDTSAEGFHKFIKTLKKMAIGKEINGIVGGLPGQLRGETGVLSVATNLREWVGLPVTQLLKQSFGCPVSLFNDVELCGLGESTHGAGTTEGVMAYYTVSTGANAVRIVDGQVDRTIGWYELGKQIINHDQKYPIELEPLVGGAALEHRTGLKPHDVKDPEIWRQIEHFLAIGLFNTALYWNPKLIVLGGSMMVDIKLDKLQVEMNNLPDVLAQRPTLVLAKLTDEAGLIGAAEMASQLGYK